MKRLVKIYDALKKVTVGIHLAIFYRHISHFMQNIPFPSPQRPRILVQVTKKKSSHVSLCSLSLK